MAGTVRGQDGQRPAMVSAVPPKSTKMNTVLPLAPAILASPALNWRYGGLKLRQLEAVARLVCLRTPPLTTSYGSSATQPVASLIIRSTMTSVMVWML